MATDFGTDCASIWTAGGAVDLDPYFTIVTGRAAVAHAVMRRFVVDPQSSPLSWDPTCGVDLRALLNEGLVRSQLPAVAAAVRREALKDERVDDASATVRFADGGALTIELSVDTAEGPFSLVLSVTRVTVALLSSTGL